MSDTKSQVEIKIVATADTSGAKEMSAALKEVDKAETQNVATEKQVAEITETASEATGKLADKKKILRDAAKGLAVEFPILGRAIGFLTNPITAVIAVLAVLAAAFHRAFSDAQNAIDSVDFSSLENALADQREALNNAKRAAGEFSEALNNISKGDNPILKKYSDAEAAVKRLMVAQAELDSTEKALKIEQINMAEKRGQRGEAGGITEAEAIRMRGEVNKQYIQKSAATKAQSEKDELARNRQELKEIQDALPGLINRQKEMEEHLRSATFRNDKLIPRNLADRKADLAKTESERQTLQNELGANADRDFTAEIAQAEGQPDSDASVAALIRLAEKKERLNTLLATETNLKRTIADLENERTAKQPEIGRDSADLKLLESDIHALTQTAAQLKLAIERAEKQNPAVQQIQQKATDNQLKTIDVQTQEQMEDLRFKEKIKNQREEFKSVRRWAGGGDLDPDRSGDNEQDVRRIEAAGNRITNSFSNGMTPAREALESVAEALERKTASDAHRFAEIESKISNLRLQ